LVIAYFHFSETKLPRNRSTVSPYIYQLGKVPEPVIFHCLFRYAQSIRSWLTMFTQRSFFQGKSQLIEQASVTKTSIIVRSWSAGVILKQKIFVYPRLWSSLRPYNLDMRNSRFTNDLGKYLPLVLDIIGSRVMQRIQQTIVAVKYALL